MGILSYSTFFNMFLLSDAVNLNIKATSSTTNITMVLEETLNISLPNIVKIILVLSGVEEKPGPPNTMFLLNAASITENISIPLIMVFKDGMLTGDFSTLTDNSSLLTNLLKPVIDECNCRKHQINLPDFFLSTGASLIQLLSTGETEYIEEDERREIILYRLSSAVH